MAVNLIRAGTQLNVGGYALVRPYHELPSHHPRVSPSVTTAARTVFQAVADLCFDWSLPLPVKVLLPRHCHWLPAGKEGQLVPCSYCLSELEGTDWHCWGSHPSAETGSRLAVLPPETPPVATVGTAVHSTGSEGTWERQQQVGAW